MHIFFGGQRWTQYHENASLELWHKHSLWLRAELNKRRVCRNIHVINNLSGWQTHRHKQIILRVRKDYVLENIQKCCFVEDSARTLSVCVLIPKHTAASIFHCFYALTFVLKKMGKGAEEIVAGETWTQGLKKEPQYVTLIIIVIDETHIKCLRKFLEADWHNI